MSWLATDWLPDQSPANQSQHIGIYCLQTNKLAHIILFYAWCLQHPGNGNQTDQDYESTQSSQQREDDHVYNTIQNIDETNYYNL